MICARYYVPNESLVFELSHRVSIVFGQLTRLADSDDANSALDG